MDATPANQHDQHHRPWTEWDIRAVLALAAMMRAYLERTPPPPDAVTAHTIRRWMRDLQDAGDTHRAAAMLPLLRAI